MKRFLLLPFLLFLIVNALSAQTYTNLVRQADSLYKSKNYQASATKYSQAFKIEKKKSFDLYNGACSAALAGDRKNAFLFLNAAVQQGWTNINHLSNDPDLASLHGDDEWKKLLRELQLKIDAIEAKYDKPLQAELLEIHREDQEIRQAYNEATDKFGYSHSRVDSLRKVMLHKDSINLKKVTKILDERGWVGPGVVGNQANQTLFLVIQHSNQSVQEKYLPMMRDAVRKGNAQPAALALLEDRVALGQGKKQKYGSQIHMDEKTQQFYVAAIEDPDHVDQRRASVGLEPIASYVSRYNIVWNLEEYKRQLPEYERLLKKSVAR